MESATLVDSYSSDLATYYNETNDFGSGIVSRLANDTAPDCDWDKIFTTPLPKDLANCSINVGLISYSLPNPPTSQARIYCDSIAQLAFPTYTLDTSLETNMLHLVQLDKFSHSSREPPRHEPRLVPRRLVRRQKRHRARTSTDRARRIPHLPTLLVRSQRPQHLAAVLLPHLSPRSSPITSPLPPHRSQSLPKPPFPNTRKENR